MDSKHPAAVWEGTRDMADFAHRQPLFVEVALFFLPWLFSINKFANDALLFGMISVHAVMGDGG